MKPLILVGGGGHCKSVIDVAESAGYTILGILDRPEEVGKRVLGYEVIGTDDEMAKYKDQAEFVVTVGQIKSPDLRIKLHQMLDKAGCKLATVIAPTAHVSRYATVGEGTVVMHQAVVNADAKIGISTTPPSEWIQLKHKDFGFFAALPAGVSKGYDLLCNYVKQLPMIFTKEGATKVGGFGTIGKLFPSVWDWESFWFNTAFLAIMLAVMNALPIPALDGGHVLFLLFEIITGKKASDKVLETAQTIGMLLLLALMLYANGADIFRAIFD